MKTAIRCSEVGGQLSCSVATLGSHCVGGSCARAVHRPRRGKVLFETYARTWLAAQAFEEGTPIAVVRLLRTSITIAPSHSALRLPALRPVTRRNSNGDRGGEPKNDRPRVRTDATRQQSSGQPGKNRRHVTGNSPRYEVHAMVLLYPFHHCPLCFGAFPKFFGKCFCPSFTTPTGAPALAPPAGTAFAKPSLVIPFLPFLPTWSAA